MRSRRQSRQTESRYLANDHLMDLIGYISKPEHERVAIALLLICAFDRSLVLGTVKPADVWVGGNHYGESG